LRRPNNKKPPTPTNATASTIKPTLAEPVPPAELLDATGVVGAGAELPGTTSVAAPFDAVDVGVFFVIAVAVADAANCAVLVAVGDPAMGAVVAGAISVTSAGCVGAAVTVATGDATVTV
jgi:hypothetical protein